MTDQPDDTASTERFPLGLPPLRIPPDVNRRDWPVPLQAELQQMLDQAKGAQAEAARLDWPGRDKWEAAMQALPSPPPLPPVIRPLSARDRWQIAASGPANPGSPAQSPAGFTLRPVDAAVLRLFVRTDPDPYGRMLEEACQTRQRITSDPDIELALGAARAEREAAYYAGMIQWLEGIVDAQRGFAPASSDAWQGNMVTGPLCRDTDNLARVEAQARRIAALEAQNAALAAEAADLSACSIIDGDTIAGLRADNARLRSIVDRPASDPATPPPAPLVAASKPALPARSLSAGQPTIGLVTRT